MKKRRQRKFIHEGPYVAEVEVDLIETNEDWSPYLSIEDACKMDDIREALRRGDTKEACRHARVYTLTPIAV